MTFRYNKSYGKSYSKKSYKKKSYDKKSYDKKYEFTAFTEADFLGQGGNGSSIGCGDSFTMPGSATVTLSTWDNDSKLSGDCRDNATDHHGQNAYVDGARTGGQMYAEQYHVLKGSDGKKYYLIEIEIEGHDAPGAGDDYFTFYGAVPPAGVELTVVKTCNVSGCWVDFKCLGAGADAPVNEAPTFTNIPADGIFCVDENQTFVIDLAAEDADGDMLTYEIVGGADASAFAIDAETGELTFIAGPDYEAPTDADGNNVYDVTVKVSDGNGGEEIKPLWIKVKDVDEGTTPGGTCFVVEAEDMALCGYRVENNANASEGQLIKGSVCGWSSAATVFDGPDGEYDLKLSVLDECDGQGRIVVTVNGCWVLDTRLNQDNGGNGVHNSTFNVLEINDIDLKAGDVVKIWGYGHRGEYVRIDKLEFCGEAGDPMTAELGDTVWFDTDKDGIRDGDELGAANVTVLLKDAAGNTIDQTETDAQGNYLFSGLAAGDYKVSVVAPGAYAFTGQDAGSDEALDSDVDAMGMSALVTLAEGESNLDVDAGLVDPGTASIEGRVFCDENDNDIDDATDGAVDNVVVTLLNADGSPTGLTTTTAADGSYSFTGLDAGDYKVMFDPNTVDGKTFVAQDAGNDDTIDSDADANGMTGVFSLTIGETVQDVDAGVETVPGSISGTYFCDDNNNDVDDAGDTDISGKLVTLLGANELPVIGANGLVILPVFTDANGDYSFEGVLPGTYKVMFERADGKGFVAQDAGNDDAIDSDVNSNGMSGLVTVTAGTNTPDVDAGVAVLNTDPMPQNDLLKTCADMAASVNLLANDTDADAGDILSVLSISDADEMAFVGETLTLESGATVTLNADGTVLYDPNNAHDDLLVGNEYPEETVTYVVSDGNGGTGEATLNITACGTKSTLQMICDALPDQIDLAITFDGIDFIVNVEDGAGAADDGLAGAWSGVCIDINGMLLLDTDLTANVYGPCETLPADVLAFPENLDNISWILNEEFIGQDNMAGTGTYTIFDVQEAVWVLSDGTATTNANANEIATKALAAGEGFEAGEGDLVAVVFDPIAPAGSGVADTQSFIMGVDWEAIDLDCLC